MTQHNKILQALREAGDTRINSFTARQELRIIQLPTRVWELKKLGYDITEKINSDKSVNYILHEVKKQYIYEGNTAKII